MEIIKKLFTTKEIVPLKTVMSLGNEDWKVTGTLRHGQIKHIVKTVQLHSSITLEVNALYQ